MDPEEAIFDVEDAMNKVVEYLLHDFTGVRTGKASPALIENIDVHVHAYGSVMKLKGLAVISSPEPRMLVVQPFDPATTRDIERAIRESKLSLNPAAAERSIRVPIPELSEERRRDMVKLIKQLAEEAKVAVRNIRRDGNKMADTGEKDKDFSEDDRDQAKEQIQELTKTYEAQATDLAKAREKEVMEE